MRLSFVFLIFLFLGLSFSVFSQNVGINDDNSNPDPSAMLDVKSQTKGVLIPRMTTTQRTSIASPATGLLVYDNTTTSFWFYNGTKWVELLSGTVTDKDTLTLTGNILSISSGNTVDLSSFLDNTDAQTLTFNNDSLSISGGNKVGLSSLNTDSQTLALSNDSLSISGGNKIDLSTVNTDSQTLTFNNDSLSISGGNKVDLSTINTDKQTLTLTGDSLFISGGNKISLAVFANDTLPLIQDADRNTKVQVEKNANEDVVRFDMGGTEYFNMTKGGRLSVENSGESVFIGEDAGKNDDLTTNKNVAIGYQSLTSNVTGVGNVGVGFISLKNNTANSNTAVGYQSMPSNTTGTWNSAFGQSSLLGNTTGTHNVALGGQALAGNTTGSSNIAIGMDAHLSHSTGDNNVVIGYNAGANNINGGGNLFLGYSAGSNETGSDKLYIENSSSSTPLIYGNFANDSVKIYGTLNIQNKYSFPNSDGTSNQLMMTNGAGALSWISPSALGITETDPQVSSTTTNYVPKWNGTTLVDGIIYDNGTRIGIGTTSPNQQLEITGNFRLPTSTSTAGIIYSGANRFIHTIGGVFVGPNAGNLSATGAVNVGVGNNAFSSLSSGNYNVGIGYNSLSALTSGYSNTAIGYNAMQQITTSGDNTAIGSGALKSLTTGGHNIAIGSQSMGGLVSASDNLAIGYGALSNNTVGDNFSVGNFSLNANTTGQYNTGTGNWTLNANTTGSKNTVVGYSAFRNSTTGSNNTVLGYAAGQNATGSGNLFLGYQAGYSETGDNKLYIDNSNTSTPLIYGNFANDSVKIYGTLNVRNKYSFPNTDGTSGQVLTTNGAGALSWANATVNTDAQTLTIDNTNANLSISNGNTVTLSTISDADANTKVMTEESANDNRVSIYANGTNTANFTNTGLGIGTTSPSYKLHVTDNVNSSLGVWTDGTGPSIIYKANQGGTKDLKFTFENSSGTQTEVARIVGNGNTGYFGIGTTIPSQKLHVEGTILAENPGTSPTGSQIYLSSPANDIGVTLNRGDGSGGVVQRWDMKVTSDSALRFRSANANDYVAFTNKGYVGIGETSPAAYLDIKGTNSGTTSMFLRSGNVYTSSSSNQIAFGYNGSTNYSHAIKTRHMSGAKTGNAIDFYVWDQGVDANGTIGTKRVMTIDGNNNGMVGIGTSTPQNELHVVGNIRMVDGNQSLGGIMVSDANGTGSWSQVYNFLSNRINVSTNSIFMGDQSGSQFTSSSTGYNNTAMGRYSQQNTNAGYENSSFGAYSLQNITSGVRNTAIGTASLLTNTTGGSNVAIGFNVLYNSTASDNTAIGEGAMYYNTIGTTNVAVGKQSLIGITTGNNNTAIGGYAGYSVGSGSNNVFLGYQAGYSETGSNKLYIHNGSSTTPLIYGDFGSSYIDINGNLGVGIANATPSYKLQVGTSGDGTEARANAWNTFSDRRFKKDFKLIENALAKVQAVNGYYYKWKDRPDTTLQVGVIAQEIEAVLPEVVSTDAEGYKSVDYSKLTALLIEALKEQQAIIENQEKSISDLKDDMAMIKQYLQLNTEAKK